VERTRERLSQRAANAPTISQPEVEILRRQARQYIPHTVERLARNFGFNYASLRISSAHTRWGSCSGRNGISISLFTMLLPEHLREFIILHELCHTIHHNHSAEFHALLNKVVCGNETQLNRELKGHHIPKIQE
jgi:predicted metal-dependent hydrolase